MTTIDEMRAEAAEHAKQLDAVRWLTAKDLVVRWGVSAKTVLLIPHEKLPYITLGTSKMRRYHPDDVERFEAEERKVPEAQAS